MPTQQLWALGGNVSSILLTPQSKNTATGALTDTTPTYQFFGNVTDLTFSLNNTMENLTTMDRSIANFVPVEADAILKMTELEKTVGNLAALASYTHSLFKAVVTRGDKGWTFYCSVESYEMSASKPRVTGVLTLRMIDPGTGNPVYA